MTAVSVVLPVHNGAAYLGGSIDSILRQTITDLELIVVDDGSTDGSAEIAAARGDARIRILKNERQRGLAATLNRGLREARAPIVARQDADDLSHPKRLERQLALLAAHQEIGLVGTQAWSIGPTGRGLGAVDHACEHAGLVWEMLWDNGFVHTSVAFRTQVVRDDLGGYDARYAYNQDFDLWWRLSRIARVANLPERLVAARVHPGSMTQTMSAANAEGNRVLLARNSGDLLGPLATRDLDLVTAFREGLTDATLGSFLAVHGHLLAHYRRRYPEETATRDFQLTLARQYLALAFFRRHRTPTRIARALWAGHRFAGRIASAAVARGVLAARLAAGASPGFGEPQ